jgi:hypothetical protein
MYIYPYAAKVVSDFLSDNDFIVEKVGCLEAMKHIEKFKYEAKKENCDLSDLNVFMGHTIISCFKELPNLHTDKTGNNEIEGTGTISGILYKEFSEKFNSYEKYKDIMLLVNMKTAKFSVIKFIDMKN